MMRRTLLFFLGLVGNLVVNAQQSAAVLEYINTYKQLAMEEMQRTGVPAAIKLAQGIHETEAGKSELVLKSNNHFGIKCKTSWTGGKVYHDDDARGECFRSYAAPEESYRDHSNFLRSNQRYSFLFQLNPEDYQGWAYGLKKAGYATNIKYSQLLIKLIETYDLQQYSLIALGKKAPSDELLAGIRPPAESVPAEAIPAFYASRPEQGPETAPAVVKNNTTRVAKAYPDGVFRINGARVVFATRGSSLLALAQEHQLSLARLLEYNEITPGEGDILAEDQLLFLQRKRKTGEATFHQVKDGDRLYDIAQEYGIRYASLLALNNLSEGMEPAAGERLSLKHKAPSRPALAGSIAGNFTRHIVQSKETLYGISRKYGVSLNQLMEWNKLNGSSLKTGQELIIYTN